jgi:hypothetical protein
MGQIKWVGGKQRKELVMEKFSEKKSEFTYF